MRLALSKWCVTIACMVVMGAPLAAPDPAELASQRSTAERQRADLRNRIQSLQKELDAREAVRKEAADALKASEVGISHTTRRLDELATQLKKARAELEELKKQIQRQQSTLALRREELSDQLRRQYASGLSPWAALLSGDDPQELSRNLAYLDYVSQARAKAVAELKVEIERLAQLEARLDARQKEVAQLVEETSQQRALLETQKKERATVLARIEGQIQAQRSEAVRLGQDDQRLSGLIDNLGSQIQAAKKAEEARRAQEARKAEEARRAEQARQAEIAKRAEEARRAEIARQAEQAQQARISQDEQRASQAIQAQEEQQIEKAKRAAQERERAQTARASESAAAPQSGEGLKKGLRWPLRGTVMARFGTDRPEGGMWRGVLIKAPDGAPVHAVGGGTVVYANWLRGFGNLLIVDHGEQYLSVYAYNQSLLKQVGDTIRPGDTVALAGSTGGQVDSALYFEIRHRGAAVDPLAFLSR
ncbi:murein hydrolase activator EnvC family protein [Zwartia panacis]|uniref:murein hydrolase activator EnvC family protein n=1 Tax=Zwartia panacis TaxID=2683345 RepID=UPI0025B3D7FD|nr:peptidoglycan DD-metalloendopeptidase family protein [Zwartia panacis]MDN4017219.1 peptidoglycan DD-metalloendopeptidase family protein [Zwartia panacis]